MASTAAPAAVAGAAGQRSAERDEKGQEVLKDEQWKRMDMSVGGGEHGEQDEDEEEEDNLFEQTFTRLYGKMSWSDKLRLFWLSATLFFIIGGYWLLRSLKVRAWPRRAHMGTVQPASSSQRLPCCPPHRTPSSPPSMAWMPSPRPRC